MGVYSNANFSESRNERVFLSQIENRARRHFGIYWLLAQRLSAIWIVDPNVVKKGVCADLQKHLRTCTTLILYVPPFGRSTQNGGFSSETHTVSQ